MSGSITGTTKHNIIIILPAFLIGIALQGQQSTIMNEQTKAAEVAVWDTYVTRKDRRVMHFDIIAPSSQRDTATIHGYGREYLKAKGEDGQALTAKECRFCHMRALQPKWEEDIHRQGYFILEMEHCD